MKRARRKSEFMVYYSREEIAAIIVAEQSRVSFSPQRLEKLLEEKARIAKRQQS